MTRYADGPTTSVEIQVDASPAIVWGIVSDPALPARFSEELVEAGWGDHPSGEPGVGSVIEGRNHNDFMGEWTTRSIVTEWEPERAFGWAVRDVEDSAARWRFELEPAGGGTLLRQHYRIGPGTSGVSVYIEQSDLDEERIIASRLRFQARNMLANLEAVKQLAEGGERTETGP